MLLAAETQKGTYVNTPQLKPHTDFCKLAWRTGVRNFMRDFSFQHLKAAILNTSHSFSPHRGHWCGIEVSPEITKQSPSAAEVGEVTWLKHPGPDSWLVYIIVAPKPVTLRLCRFTPTEHLALRLWEEDIMCLMLHAFLNSCFEGALQASHETICPRWKLWKGLIVHKWFKTAVFTGHKGTLTDIFNVISCFLANLFANQVGEEEIMSSSN